MSEKNKTIQEKMKELSELVDWFHGEEFNLEESIEKFREAEGMAAEIESDLMSLKNDIQVIKERFDN